MNSFDLLKFKNKLLAENEDYEKASREVEYGYNIDGIDYDDETSSDLFIDEDLDEGTLEEMAKISGDLKSSIEAVIAANPDLQGLALKKAIKSDDNVINALAGDNLYDNQLNRFISLTKGERQNQSKDRPTNPNKTATAPKDKSPKLKITNPKPKSTSTKLKDLAPADVFMGADADEEEIGMDKEAMKAAKNADAELGNELGKVSGIQAAKDFLKRNASKTLNIVKKSNAGQELTSNEQKYLDKTRKLTSLIKKDKASFTASNISGQEEA